jgi:hypothetical protein
MKSTSPFPPARRRVVSGSGLLGGLAVALSLGMGGPALATGPADSVGSVSLLIGEAWVVRPDGSQQALQRGTPVRVGDRIETSANGHVHMRFVDNAAVSVRPQSSLEVQSYHFDPLRPELNEVRLRVEKGTSRSISGAATDLDKSRFRLNTPIAAIGVRGTDFIVQADAAGVRATVSDGAIAMGALGGDCSASGLGPCAGAKELSADMGRLMAEVRANDQSTRLVPAVDLSVADAGSRRARGTDNPAQSLSEARALSLAAAEPTGLEAQRGNDRAAAELLTLAAVRVPDLNRPSDLSGQLIWGRWAIGAAENENLSVPFALARLGRHVTVGDSQMGLFRADQSVPGQLFGDTLQGTVEMNLNRASASYEIGSEVQTAGISASNLTIDFTRRTFATALNLFSAGGVQGELRASGAIRADGLFTVRDSEQYVSGALSLDGKEAGYLFERSAGGGLFRGRTLWGP